MLTAHIFDRERGEDVEDWAGSVSELSDDQLLWVDLLEPSQDEKRAAWEGFGLAPLEADTRTGTPTAALELGDDFIRVTAVAVSDEEQDPERETVLIECLIGPNWVLTVHAEKIAVLDDFRSLAVGGGALGVLAAPSFLATLLEWVVTSYSRAFAEIESTLEEFDVAVLRSAKGETEKQISVLVTTRSRVGRLRRALSPHREIFATLASILLLPGALIAGVMGMNINFKPSAFVQSAVFWIGTVSITGIALVTLGFARRRDWI